MADEYEFRGLALPAILLLAQLFASGSLNAQTQHAALDPTYQKACLTGVSTCNSTRRAAVDATRQKPTAAQIAEALRPKDTRSLGPGAPQENGYFLVLTFATGSADLTSTDKAALQEFGKAFREFIPGVPVTIEGHADPRGTDDYNRSLSEQRATVVRNYLVNELGANPQQFEVVGFGKSRLRDEVHPFAEVNRRVEFVTRND